ncbi:Myb/SANT-like DNA-binding domain-containing protein 3 [Acropora cervicornis]|uniref:Myb/SANT-like DNA-binding domain-containing protein 3 n=1 Tax=Acropora cervicornis TaxID=6130 RepID=A0AAD9QU42_ACRCE|nr:Myb/SANT-like DNA-binding domain-containing protein 3 [Acropora cervicornis]
MASKMSRKTNFSEQEKLLLAELGNDFPEVESKGYDSKTLAKKAKAWEEILTRFNSQIPNGIKRDLSQLQGCWKRLKLQSKKEHDLHRREAKKSGGGGAPASPSEVSKLVADALPASVNPLEQEFDDDAGEQLDLRRDKDEREVITCLVEPSVLADLEATGKKGADKVTKKEDNQRYSNFQSPLKLFQ